MTNAIDTSIKDAIIVLTDSAFPVPCNAIYVGVSGDISVVLAQNGKTVLFKAVPVGVLYVKAAKVNSSGTTATNMLACYT